MLFIIVGEVGLLYLEMNLICVKFDELISDLVECIKVLVC